MSSTFRIRRNARRSSFDQDMRVRSIRQGSRTGSEAGGSWRSSRRKHCLVSAGRIVRTLGFTCAARPDHAGAGRTCIVAHGTSDGRHLGVLGVLRGFRQGPLACIVQSTTPALDIRTPASPSSISKHVRVRHRTSPNSTRSRARSRHRHALAPISAGGRIAAASPLAGNGRKRQGRRTAGRATATHGPRLIASAGSE